MTEPEVDQGMEILSLAECERLLIAGGVGILALGGGEAPVLRPVNFAVHELSVWLRTGEGQILAAARARRPASFVVSSIDRLEHLGHSVVVTGKLAEHKDDDEPELRLRPWVRSDKHHLVALSIDEMSGRRIARPSGDP
jgi:nitroimidazol reductase NimA-like FMN-containing flavoprotein (pyridoxamine 5'-phosphate oxidase superfamily)